MTKKDQIINKLKALSNDCVSMLESLEENDILAWDVRDYSNWDSMNDNIEEVINYIENTK